MVDSRFRRRTLQRVILGIRTPRQTRTPELFFPAGEKSWGDADPRHLRSGSLPARQLRVVPMVPAAALAHHESYGVSGGTKPAERARSSSTAGRPRRARSQGPHESRISIGSPSQETGNGGRRHPAAPRSDT
jgi:hypothetical protein